VLAAVQEQALTLDYGDVGLREIPRRILANLLKGDLSVEESVKAAMIDICAMVLSVNGEPADTLLLQSAARRAPRCRFLWPALGRLGGITDKDSQIAKKTVQDDKLPVMVRAAAAMAVSGRDPEAAAFAVKQIRDLLARYGDRYSEDEIKSIGKFSDKTDFERYLQEFGESQEKDGLVTMLRFLETPDAEALTFDACQCKNMYISQSAAAVAACRWPERFLKGDRGTLSQQAYADLLALIAVKEPGCRDEVLKKISEKELDQARGRMRQYHTLPGTMLATDHLIFLFFCGRTQ
jgi:hypothetical protein